MEKDSTGMDEALGAKWLKANYPGRKEMSRKTLSAKRELIKKLTKDWTTNVMR